MKEERFDVLALPVEMPDIATLKPRPNVDVASTELVENRSNGPIGCKKYCLTDILFTEWDL